MIQEGLKNVTSGANPVGLREGIDKAVRVVTSSTRYFSKVENKNEIAQVGAISAKMKKLVNTFLKQWIKLVMMVLLPLKNQMD